MFHRMRSFALFALLLMLTPLAVLAREASLLTATYSDEAITFAYPEDWVVESYTDNIVLLSNSRESLYATPDQMQAGQLQITIIKSFADIEGVGTEFVGDKTPRELLSSIMEVSSGNNTYGKVGEFNIGDRSAVYVDVVDNVLKAEGFFVLVELGNGNIGMVSASTAPGQSKPFKDIVLNIAETLSAAQFESDQLLMVNNTSANDEVALTQILVLSDGTFKMKYPEGWLADEDGGIVFMVNRESVLEATDLNDLADGDVVVVVYPTIADVPDYPVEVNVNVVPSTIVSFMASMGMITGYQQDGPMGALTIDGREVSTVFNMMPDGHDRMVLAIDTGEGNVSTLVAFAAPGQLKQHEDTLLAILASFDQAASLLDLKSG